MKSLQEIREDLETNQERIDSEQPEHIDEGLLKTLAVGFMVLKVRSLMKEVQRENDPVKQNVLIARQNAMLSYLTGVSIFSSTGKDRLEVHISSRTTDCLAFLFSCPWPVAIEGSYNGHCLVSGAPWSPDSHFSLEKAYVGSFYELEARDMPYYPSDQIVAPANFNHDIRLEDRFVFRVTPLSLESFVKSAVLPSPWGKRRPRFPGEKWPRITEWYCHGDSLEYFENKSHREFTRDRLLKMIFPNFRTDYQPAPTGSRFWTENDFDHKSATELTLFISQNHDRADAYYDYEKGDYDEWSLQWPNVCHREAIWLRKRHTWNYLPTMKSQQRILEGCETRPYPID